MLSVSPITIRKASRFHRLAVSDEKYDSKSDNSREKIYVCRWCTLSNGDEDPILRHKRTSYYCKECSDLPISQGKKVFLHSEYYASFHNWIEEQYGSLEG